MFGFGRFSCKQSECVLSASQILRRDAMMLLFVIHDDKLNIFGFWTVGPTKQDV